VEEVEITPRRVLLEGAEGGEGKLLIEIAEGKKREVRLLARAAGLFVRRLQRIRFGPIRLENLPPGTSRPLTKSEVRALQAEARPVRTDPRGRGSRRGPRG